MNRIKLTPPNQTLATSRYQKPVIDKLLGRTTLEWECDDGHKEKLQASLRFTDYEGNKPSLYSIRKLPYVLKTYFESKRSGLISNPVPFLTMDSIRFLDSMVRPGLKVLEIGGGNSSLWFLERCVNLTTYEHNIDWGMMLLNEVNENPGRYHPERFNLKMMKGRDVINDVNKLEDKSFDILLVDSMNDYTRRVASLRAAMKKVKPGGWIILDNSDNPANWNADELMKEKEMHRFTGYAPMSLFVCQTTFWKV